LNQKLLGVSLVAVKFSLPPSIPWKLLAFATPSGIGFVLTLFFSFVVYNLQVVSPKKYSGYDCAFGVRL
jgi:Na+/H+ antiporter NhaA